MSDKKINDSVYCKNCGMNITRMAQHDIDGEKYCSDCKEELYPNEGIEDTWGNDLNNNTNNENKIAGVLKTVGIVTMILGFIVGLYIGDEASFKFSFVASYPIWISTFALGVILIGLSEVINLLNKIYGEIKKQGKL